MRLLGLLTAFFAICGCAAAPAPIQNDVSPEEKAEFIKAMSKAAAPNGRQIKSMRLTYDAELPAQKIKMKVITAFKAPDKLRLESRIPNMPAMLEIFDGKEGWNVTEGLGVKKKTGRELMFIKLQTLMNNPATMLNFIFKEIKMEQEPVTVNGKKCRRLVCTWITSDIPPIEIFVGSDDKLVYRTILTVPTAMGDVNSVTDFSKYKNFDGLVMPSFQQSTALGMKTSAKLIKCELDIPLDDKLFKPQNME